MSYPVEEIPDEDIIFRRIIKDEQKNGIVKPRAFKEKNGGMSTNWIEYATAEKTLSEGLPHPLGYYIIKFIAGKVRSIGLKVIHDPLYPPPIDNRAHTNVKEFPIDEADLTEVRLKLVDLAEWEIFS